MTARRIRVLHLITRLDLGGAQQNTLFCVAHHDRRRFEPHLIAGAGGTLDAEAQAIGDARVELVPWLVHPIEPARDVAAVDRIRRYLVERRIDVVHTHSSKAGILGRVAAHLARTPGIVHTVHGWSFNPTQSPPRRAAYVLAEKLVAAFTDCLVVVSAADRARGIELGIGRPARYLLSRSGIDFEPLAGAAGARDAARAELGYGPADVVVGMVGNLKPQKGPLDFVRAAAAARARDPRLRFFLAGDGPLREQAEAAIEALGAGSFVRLLGWRRDVERLYAAMDVFLLTSLFEGLPRSVLQAMAAGVPVVATAVDGTPEVVAHERSGLLVPPGDPAAAADAVVRMAGDEDLRRRCAAAARESVGTEFDIRGMLGRLEALYLALLRR